MRLHVSLPDWTRLDAPHQTVFVAPGSAPNAPSMMLAVGVIVPHSTDENTRRSTILGVELGGHALKIAAGTCVETLTGWPIELTPAIVHSGDQIIEQRLLALYRFAEWRAHVLVRGFQQAVWEARSAEVRTALLAAQPDWRADDEVYCLAHLYE